MPNIGSLHIVSDLVAAPLCGISDYAFRQLARDFGAGLTYTEMISAVAIQRNDKKTLSFSFTSNEHPLAVQLFGCDPQALGYAASHFEQRGADIIDLNLGCSVKKVHKQGSGSILQRDLSQVSSILNSMRKALRVPLTIKCRLGWSPKEENYLELAKIAEGEGVDAICLHPRYATQFFAGKADWHKFHDLAKTVKIPLIGSGDIKTSMDIDNVRAGYPVDFIMLGRALVGNPWILSNTSGQPERPILQTMQRHFDLLCSIYNEKKAALLFRKYIGKYLRGLPRAQELRVLGNQVLSKADVTRFLTLLHV